MRYAVSRQACACTRLNRSLFRAQLRGGVTSGRSNGLTHASRYGGTHALRNTEEKYRHARERPSAGKLEMEDRGDARADGRRVRHSVLRAPCDDGAVGTLLSRGL